MKHKPYNALVVDWDYFFPLEPRWDWAHAENELMIEGIWPIRAAFLVAQGEPLPKTLPWEGFWERFNITADTCYFADSNAEAYTVLAATIGKQRAGVWLFDQHHDCGYRGPASIDRIEGGHVTCEDWMIPLGMAAPPWGGENLHVLYPNHTTEPLETDPEPYFKRLDRRYDRDLEPGYLPDSFDVVFVCRSGAWVPPWEDERFFEFVTACPATTKVNLDQVGIRDFDPSMIVDVADHWRTLGWLNG